MKWWDVHTGENKKTFTGYLGGKLITYSPDKKTIAITAGGLVYLWDVATGQYLRTLKGHRSNVSSVDFSPDSKILATGSRDHTVRLWDMHTGQTIRILEGHTDLVYGPVYSPDGSVLATRSRDDTLRLWNASTGKNIKTILRGSEGMNFMFSPDSTTFAVGNSNGTVGLFDAQTGEKIKTLRGNTDYIYTVLYSPNGNKILTKSRDGTVVLWNAHTKKEINTLNIRDKAIAAMYSPDGTPLAISVNREKLSLWDVTTAQLLKTFDGPKTRYLPKRYRGKRSYFGVMPPEQVRRVSFSPNGETIAADRHNETVQLWNISTGKHIGKPIIPLKDDPPDGTTDVVYSPDGKTLATIQIGNRGSTHGTTVEYNNRKTSKNT